jgi:uncharacterized membrane protein YecN with MAPEG domain
VTPAGSSGDKAVRQRVIRRSLWLTLPGSLALIGAAYALVRPVVGWTEPVDRLINALRWLLVAVVPYVAVCLTILYQRYAEGAHNPLLRDESQRLQIHCRVMQNTLEQLLWFVLCVLPMSTYLSPSEARLIPIVCVFFAVARLVYWWGYLRRGTLGRAPGVQLTFGLNISLFAAALLMFTRNLLA